MPDVRSLIETAQTRCLILFLEEGRVKVKAPQELDPETQALIQELRAHKEEIRSELAEEDPTLTPDQWYPEFHRFHVQVAQENPDFDRLWLKQYRPDLYLSLKAKEGEIDALHEARLSQVVAIMREWRELVLKAEFERREAHERAES